MNNDLAGPVKGIVNAFHRGTVVTQRICRAAQRAQGLNMLDTLQPAQSLGNSLEKSESSIKNAYAYCVQELGRKYLEAFDTDRKLEPTRDTYYRKN